MWILGKIFGNAVAENEKMKRINAELEASAAKASAKSIEESKDFEINLIRKHQEVEKAFKVKVESRPADDPFGAKAWNAGE
jgi:hypothetical protein